MRYLLLGLLWRAGRASGYRLQRELSILRGKPVSGGNVYKMLHLLEAEGLVERAPEGGDESFRQRSDCRLSEEGRRQLARWLEQDADSDDLYARAIFAGAVGGRAVLHAMRDGLLVRTKALELMLAKAAKPSLEAALARRRIRITTAELDFLAELAELEISGNNDEAPAHAHEARVR